MEYIYKQKPLCKIVTTYVPREGDQINYKSRRMKGIKTYKVEKISHNITPRDYDDYGLDEEKFTVFLK